MSLKKRERERHGLDVGRGSKFQPRAHARTGRQRVWTEAAGLYVISRWSVTAKCYAIARWLVTAVVVSLCLEGGHVRVY